MRIESSSISMEANREFKKTETSRTMLQLWKVEPRLQEDALSLSPEGMGLAENDIANTDHLDAIYEPEDIEDELDLYLSDEDRMKIRLLEKLISWVTGKPFKFDLIGLKDNRLKRQGPKKGRPRKVNQVSKRVKAYSLHRYLVGECASTTQKASLNLKNLTLRLQGKSKAVMAEKWNLI